uniref:Uncharacterized protein n=1 Tax=Metapenaeus ensis majanivirus TaxID=2984279 RepID=A0A9C7CDJ2_9VIRU|nr:MAG: hypothetical protein [Metapenaeus ensis majanivirus]
MASPPSEVQNKDYTFDNDESKKTLEITTNLDYCQLLLNEKEKDKYASSVSLPDKGVDQEKDDDKYASSVSLPDKEVDQVKDKYSKGKKCNKSKKKNVMKVIKHDTRNYMTKNINNDVKDENMKDENTNNDMKDENTMDKNM